MIVPGLVDPHSPKNDRGAIPVAPDHAAHIVHRDPLPGFVTNVLPTRNFLEHQQANFIAGIQKMPRLRIVRGSDNIALELVAQYLRVAPLHPAGHGLSHEGKRLVPIQSAQLDHLAVELKSVVGELSVTKTDDAGHAIDLAVSAPQRNLHRIQIRMCEIP